MELIAVVNRFAESVLPRKQNTATFRGKNSAQRPIHLHTCSHPPTKKRIAKSFISQNNDDFQSFPLPNNRHSHNTNIKFCILSNTKRLALLPKHDNFSNISTYVFPTINTSSQPYEVYFVLRIKSHLISIKKKGEKNTDDFQNFPLFRRSTHPLHIRFIN